MLTVNNITLNTFATTPTDRPTVPLKKPPHHKSQNAIAIAIAIAFAFLLGFKRLWLALFRVGRGITEIAEFVPLVKT